MNQEQQEQVENCFECQNRLMQLHVPRITAELLIELPESNHRGFCGVDSPIHVLLFDISKIGVITIESHPTIQSQMIVDHVDEDLLDWLKFRYTL